MAGTRILVPFLHRSVPAADHVVRRHGAVWLAGMVGVAHHSAPADRHPRYHLLLGHEPRAVRLSMAEHGGRRWRFHGSDQESSEFTTMNTGPQVAKAKAGLVFYINQDFAKILLITVPTSSQTVSY